MVATINPFCGMEPFSRLGLGNCKLEQKMQMVDGQIKLPRWRQDLRIVQVAERTICSPVTFSRVQKGAPTVAIVLWSRCH